MVEISNEMYERLRLILERQNGRSCSSEEAKVVGDELVVFYLLVELNNEKGENSDESLA